MQLFRGLLGRLSENIFLVYIILLIAESIFGIFYSWTLYIVLILTVILIVLSIFFRIEVRQKEENKWRFLLFAGAVFIIVLIKKWGRMPENLVFGLFGLSVIMVTYYFMYLHDDENEGFNFEKNQSQRTGIYIAVFCAVILFCILLSFKSVIGMIFLFFVPGMLLSWIYFEKMNLFERIVCGFGIGCIFTPVLIYYSDFLMGINKYSIYFIMVVFLIVLYRRKNEKK